MVVSSSIGGRIFGGGRSLCLTQFVFSSGEDLKVREFGDGWREASVREKISIAF